MHPALRKGPLFCKTTPPIFHFKNPYFHFFLQKTLPISFPAYGPDYITTKRAGS